MIALFVGIGYGVYHYGTAYASEKVMEVVSTTLEDSGQLDQVKDYLRNDPTVQEFLAEGASVDESRLPFTTKEEAIRALVPKIGVSEVKQIRSAAQGGFTVAEQKSLLQNFEQKLSEDDMIGIKYVLYKEIMQ